MAKQATKAVTESEVPEEEEEVYPKYEFTGNTININVYEGGQVIFQSGHPIPWPPKP